MVLFLLRVGISLVSAALAMLVAAWVLDDVSVSATGFVVAVVVFTAAQAILTPFVVNLARKHASALLGGIGIVSTLVALWVATLFPGGLSISGVLTWVLAALIVWVVTALGAWLVVPAVAKRVAKNRAQPA